MRASVGTYRTCRKTFIHFIFQIYLDQFYEAAGRPDTTSNSHQPILLSQSCQCLPKAPLEDGEKRAEQISSIMMEHRSRLGLQWICQYIQKPALVQSGRAADQCTELRSRRLFWSLTPGPAPIHIQRGIHSPFYTRTHCTRSKQCRWTAV